MPDDNLILLQYLKSGDERSGRIEDKLDKALEGISDLKESRAKGRGALAVATIGIPVLSGFAAFFGKMAGH